MKKIVLGFLFLLFSTNASAIFIVDTGTPPKDTATLALRNGVDSPFITQGFQWKAGQLIFTNDYKIEGVEVYIGNSKGSNHPDTLDIVSMALYGDLLNLPDKSRELFRQTVSVPQTYSHLGSGAWVGLSGLNVDLVSGKYWLAVEVLNEFDFIGSFPIGAPDPLPLYAAASTSTSGNYSSFESSLGFRVAGTSSVPEPATMALFATGLAGVLIRRRSRG